MAGPLYVCDIEPSHYMVVASRCKCCAHYTAKILFELRKAITVAAQCGPLSLEQLEGQLERRGMKAGSKEELESYYKQHSALELVNNMPENQKKAVRWFIDCGDDDFLYEGNSLVHIAMRKKEIPHQFRIREGGHNWTYWRESLPVVLSFISDAFHQH